MARWAAAGRFPCVSMRKARHWARPCWIWRSMLIETSRDGRLLRLALNRPEKRNALNIALCRELIAALEAAQHDPEIGAILLSGNGKAFCAGMDLNEVTTQVDDLHERLFTVFSSVRKPLIPDVRGPAIAGGTGLAAQAHIVFAAEEA